MCFKVKCIRNSGRKDNKYSKGILNRPFHIRDYIIYRLGNPYP